MCLLGAVPRQIKHSYHVTQNSIVQVSIQENKADVPTKARHACSQHRDAQWPKGGHSPSVHREMDTHNVSVHTEQCHSAMKRGEVLTLPTMQMDLEHRTLSERRRTHKATHCVIPFM